MHHGKKAPGAIEELYSIVRFRVGRAELGVLAHHVEEVTDAGEPTPVPCAPPHVPGIVAVRGEALPLFDLAIFLGLPSGDGGAEMPRMLIVRSPPYRVGVLCDRVSGVATVPGSAIQPVRASGPRPLRRYALGEVEMGGTVAPVLDVALLLAAGRAR